MDLFNLLLPQGGNNPLARVRDRGMGFTIIILIILVGLCIFGIIFGVNQIKSSDIYTVPTTLTVTSVVPQTRTVYNSHTKTSYPATIYYISGTVPECPGKTYVIAASTTGSSVGATIGVFINNDCVDLNAVVSTPVENKTTGIVLIILSSSVLAIIIGYLLYEVFK